MVGVRQEAVVREHAVAADFDPLVRGDHAPEVHDRSLPDRDRRRIRIESEPAARLDQHPGADRGAALVERLEKVAHDREADIEVAPQHVPAEPQLPCDALVALVVAPLPPEQARLLPKGVVHLVSAVRARNS
jgi:hypothetical protein